MKYNLNGNYVLDEVALIHERGEVDLSSIFMSINLYESMDDMGMSGDILVVDTRNLTEILPLYGNEEIRLSFRTAGNDKNPIVFTGYVYKVSPKSRLSEHSTAFIIHFCSILTMKSERMFVNTGFEEQTVGEIVEELYDHIQDPNKPLEASQTKGKHTLTLGNVHPLESISRLSRKAVSATDDHSYVFFENHQKVVFKPLQELYAQEPVASYAYLSQGVYQNVDKRYEEQFESVQEYEIYDENSLLDRIYDGVHGSKHVMFDLITKDYLDVDEDVDYQKSEWFDSSKSLGNQPDRKEIEKKEDEVFLTFGYGESDKLLHKNFIDSKMKLRESELFRADITVFGDSMLKAGDVLNVYIPNLNMDQNNLKSIYTGNFLVSRIRHFLTRTEYLQVIHIKKDAYEEKSL